MFLYPHVEGGIGNVVLWLKLLLPTTYLVQTRAPPARSSLALLVKMFLGLSISLWHFGMLVGVHVCGMFGEEGGRVVQLFG